MTAYTNEFENRLSADQSRTVKKRIFDAFRNPFNRRDITTHGQLWNQYASPQGTAYLQDIALDDHLPGFILIEKKNADLFSATFGDFKQMLECSEDGLYPATYFVDEQMMLCLGENGERGTMKPIYIYIGKRAPDVNSCNE